MTNPTYFTVIGDYKAIVADTTNDTNADPDLGVLTATVTFTPMINNGDVLLATQASPRPTGFVPAPVTGFIDTDGRLKLRAAANGDYDYTPIRLLADTPLLNLSSPLIYRVSFSNVTYDNRTGTISSFFFTAPDADTVINLIDVAPATGQNAVGITHLAPGAVRIEGTNLIFSFGNDDIPDPVSLEGLRGPTGATGAAATISISSVTTGAPGSTATAVNVGTSGAAELQLSIPRGDTGATGATGAAATIAVGTVSTGSVGSTASVTNVGTSGAAVLDFTIPRGNTGDTGSTGPTGATGAAATIAVGTVSTGAVGSTATVTNTGTSGAAVFDVSIPRGDTGDTGATGAAATIAVGSVTTGAAGSTATVVNVGTSGAATFDFSLPTGATGAVGATGPVGPTGAAATVAIGTVTTVGAGSSASVTNVGTSTAAVFDISIPKGDTGSADPSTWSTLDGRPAVVAAGATKADARTAIDAEYTGNRGQALGYASLDAAGKVPYSQLPASIMSYQGTVNMSTGVPALADGTGDQGDVYRVSVAGTRDLGSGSIAWGVGDYAIYNGSTWEKSDSTDAVASVNGYTGVVSLTKSDVGLSAVDNTADADKPISSATSTALGGKEPTITSGSTGQYYRGDKSWATLDKSAVGLSNVDNTTDVGKPISTATQTALDGKESTISSGSAGQYWTGSKTWATLNAAAVSGAEATANKGASGGYCGLDSSTKVAIGNLPTGSTSSTVCIGNDSRLSDARTPTAHTHAVADINASTTTALGVGSLELGHASDTTLSRSAAGTLAVEGVDVVTTSASQTLTSKTLTNPTITNYVESVVAIGTVTSSNTIALTNGTVQTCTLTASTACTFTMPTAVAGKSFVLMLKQAASTGNGTATFTGVKWGTAGAPTITATAGKMDILSFFSDGTNWYGSVSAGYTP